MKNKDFVTQHTHINAIETETSAAIKAGKQSESIKTIILQIMEQNGEHGLTPDEFCEMTGKLINTVRRRFTDLWKEGKIRHHLEKKTRTNKAKNECVVWVLGTDDNLKISRVQRLKLENERLRSLLLINRIPF